MAATKTAGQEFTKTLRKVVGIGPRTRRLRKYPSNPHLSTKQNVIRWALDTVAEAVCESAYSDRTNNALRPGWAAVCSWNKHVESYRLDPSQIAYLQSLSPWEFTALLGEMVDAGITCVGEGERWFEARRAADVAAGYAKLNQRQTA